MKNLNLSHFSYIKRVDGQIRLKKMKLACVVNWNSEIDFSKRIIQGIVKKLKN